MTKPGYKCIIVPIDLHQQLKTLAKQNGVSINQYIKHLMNTSIDTSIDTATPLNQQQISPFQAPYPKNNLNLSGAGGIRTPVRRARVSKPRPS